MQGNLHFLTENYAIMHFLLRFFHSVSEINCALLSTSRTSTDGEALGLTRCPLCDQLSFLTVHFEGKQRDFVPAQCRRFRARTESFPGWVKSAPVQRTGEHTEVPALVFYPIRWSITPHWGKFNLEQSSDGKSQEQLRSAKEPKAASAIARAHANS
jgi:hypothetical protein